MLEIPGTPWGWKIGPIADTVAAEHPLSPDLVRNGLEECDDELKKEPIDWERVELLISAGIFSTRPLDSEAFVSLVERIVKKTCCGSDTREIEAQIAGYNTWKESQSKALPALMMATGILPRQPSARGKQLLLGYARTGLPGLGCPYSEDLQRIAIDCVFVEEPHEAMVNGEALLQELRLETDIDGMRWAEVKCQVEALKKHLNSQGDLEEADMRRMRRDSEKVKHERLQKHAARLGEGAGELLEALEKKKNEYNNLRASDQAREQLVLQPLPAHLQEMAVSACRGQLSGDHVDWEAVRLVLCAGRFGKNQAKLSSIAAQLLRTPEKGSASQGCLRALSMAMHVVAWQEMPEAEKLLKDCSKWQYWHQKNSAWTYEQIRGLMRDSLVAAIALPYDRALDVVSDISLRWSEASNADAELADGPNSLLTLTKQDWPNAVNQLTGQMK